MRTNSERKSASRPKADRVGAANPFAHAVGTPLTAEEVAAGLLRMAAFLDRDAAARKVAADFALSRTITTERNDDNG